MSIKPSRKMTFFDTLIDESLNIFNATRILNAGMTMVLNTALPAVVPIPPAKPVVSAYINKNTNVTNSSGIELPMALIVAPLTPSVIFLPR